MAKETIQPIEPTPQEMAAAPVFYVNAVKMAVSTYDLSMILMQIDPTGRLVPQCRLLMSPTHAKVVALILAKHLAAYEREVGRIELKPGQVPVYDALMKSNDEEV